MRRIGITQRVEEVPGYGELRDCLDQRWCVLLEGLKLAPAPIPNRLSDPVSYLREGAFRGFILCGGNDLAHLPDAARPSPERDSVERAILEFAAMEELPVLGVCRGMQMMNYHLGGQLAAVEGHAGSRHPIRGTANAPLFAEYGDVNSFHNWALPTDGIAPALVAVAYAGDGTVEAVQHEWLPWVGIMWHPERETPFSEQDIRLTLSVFGN